MQVYNTHVKPSRRCFILFNFIASLMVLPVINTFAATNAVQLMRVPDGGIQPQVATDATGVVHLVYLKGDAKAADVFYAKKEPGQSSFSPSLRVNSQPGSAIAIGTIRGAQIAVGKNGRVHVAWNGSQTATPKPANSVPMLYARLNEAGTGFEPQRNLMTHTTGLDGGGSVAADGLGQVWVIWHGALTTNRKGEAGRGVFAARSRDEGKTFAAEVQINPETTGACGCCGLSALARADGQTYVLYRAATESINRNMTLLHADTAGGTFREEVLQTWQSTMCPMSSASLTVGKKQLFACWESGSLVYFRNTSSQSGAFGQPVIAPGPEKKKHPVLACNSAGDVLLAWTEGTAWQKGGSVAWQAYRGDGQPSGGTGRVVGLPVWGLAAAFAEPDGRFVILY